MQQVAVIHRNTKKYEEISKNIQKLSKLCSEIDKEFICALPLHSQSNSQSNSLCTPKLPLHSQTPFALLRSAKGVSLILSPRDM
jgi:hypothetical protein